MKIQKRLLTLLLCLSMVLSVTAFAGQTGPTVTVATENAVAGQTGVQLDVTIENNPGYNGFTWEIKYDETQLTLTDIITGGTTEVAGQQINFYYVGVKPEVNVADKTVVVFASDAVKLEGKMFTLVFDVADTVTGTAEVEIDAVNFRVYDTVNSKYETVDATYVSGGIVTPVPHQHTYGDIWEKNETHHWKICSDPECPVDGKGEKDKAEHTWDDGMVTTPATETQKGTTTYTCEVCDQTKDVDDITELGHTHDPDEVVSTPAKPAGCTEPGNSAYYYCQGCGKYFSDPACTTEIVKDSWVIPATGHDYENGTCKNCGDKEPADNPFRPVGPKPSKPSEDPGKVESDNPFTDVKESDYFYDAVLWAYENGITTGTTATTFSPLQNCTRAQVVTFLWRAANCPEPTSAACPFTDVEAGSYYEKAVLWAVEKGITKGMTETTFAPNAIVTREQFVTFLWRYAGQPTYVAGETFTDVVAGAWYADAVNWAAAEGVTLGLGNGTFGVGQPCNRAQTVTFLYRFMEGK